MSALLEHVYDVEFMLREYLGEAVGFFDGFGQLAGLVVLGVAKAAGVEDVRAHAEFCGGFACDGHLVAGDHFDGDTHIERGGDGGFGFFAGRVEEGEDAEELPCTLFIGARDAEGTKATCGKLLNGVLHGGLDMSSVFRQFQNDLAGRLSRRAVLFRSHL